MIWFTNNNNRKLQALLLFDLSKFKACFQLDTGKCGIDFQLLEQALVSSVVGAIDTSQRSTTTLREIPESSVPKDFLCYELRRFFVLGDYYARIVGTVYFNGQPIKR